MSDVLVIPHGKKTGCLPRESKVGELCPLLRGNVPIIPRGEWPELIKKLDEAEGGLRHMVRTGLDQNGVGSCAAESTTQALQILREYEGQRHVVLSPWFLYHHTSGGVDNGSTIDGNLRFARDRGIAPMDIWPRSRGWRARPSQQAYDAAKNFRIDEFFDCTNVVEIGSALLKGMSVTFGWSGHSCVLTDLISTTHARYRNSWGDNWGDNGFGVIRLADIWFGYGAFAIRSAIDANEA